MTFYCFKGTHSVYFSNSLYSIYQKPMIPRIHFYCINHMGCTPFWVKFGTHLLILWFRFANQMALLSNINFYFDCKTRLCIIVPGRQEKIYFAQERFCLQGILDDIKEEDTSFLDCKHKHMMKRGARPDKFGVLCHIVTYKIPWFHKQN